ncbi:MAG: hypothetical protein R3F48_01720 [Candidatus Zixiibacteriota bacterium]
MNRSFVLFFGLLVAVLLIAGCSDDSSTNPTAAGAQHVQFADYEELITEIAPPEYTAPAAKPFVIDPIWNSGTNPLLGKVFSEDEPMSLYANANAFENLIAQIEMMLETNDEGALVFDTNYITLTELSSATTLPTYAHDIIGTSVSVENLLDITYEGMPEGAIIQIAFTQSESVETILMYHKYPNMDAPAYFETTLYYANYIPADSSFTFKGIFLKDMSATTTARWVYDIHSVNDADFSYRMSWYSDPEGGLTNTLLGCIVGGGNKDTEFALRYRQYIPADSAEYDSTYALDQVFAANYTEGTGLISSYETYVNESLIFTYDQMPTALLASPWLAQ